MNQTRTFAEAYTMRSRHYQLLGASAERLAEAFMEADLENQRDIGRNIVEAMTHLLVERHGYTREELASIFKEGAQ